MTIDRTIAPGFQKISTITLPEPEKSSVAHPQIYFINAGTQDVLRIECLFFAGARYEQVPLTSFATNHLIKEGTTKLSSEEIATRLDYFGAFLENESNKDTASLTLYTLNKHLESALPVFLDLITDPIFPDKEVDLFLKNSQQKYLVNREKVDFLARIRFSGLLYGDNNAYGHVVKESDYDAIKKDQVVSFFKERYAFKNLVILVSGKITEREKALIEKAFSGGTADVTTNTDAQLILKPNSQKKHFHFKEGAVQSAIRIGLPLFNRTHPDYLPLLVLNTILGGYFGSRLMANIREDKGYTYGIGSGITSFHQSGMFFIATEVGSDVTRPALNEIYSEITRLREQLVPSDELELVKNYMLGVFLRSMDGPFALSDKVKTLIEYGLDSSYYQRFIETVNSIGAADIQSLAVRYLDPESMYELVVGSSDPAK